MQRAMWVLTATMALATTAHVAAQQATNPTMRVLDTAGDAARVARELDARRAETEAAPEGAERGRRANRRGAAAAPAESAAAAPRADRSAERRRRKLDEHDDERGESALDDDDVARDPAPVVTP